MSVGRDYAQSLVDAIKCSKYVVVLYSSAASSSGHVEREVERAVSFHIPIIPVRIDTSSIDTALAYFFSTLHFLDVSLLPYNDAIKKASEQIKLAISSSGSLPDFFRDESQYYEALNSLRNQYYNAGTPLDEVIAQANRLIPAGRTEEPLLIAVASLARVGKRDEARHLLITLFSLEDKAEEELIIRCYDIFISTYDIDSGMSAFLDEMSYSTDGSWAFYGQNISRQQYKQWLDSFHNIWLVLPIFHTIRDVSSAPEPFFIELVDRLPGFPWPHTMLAKYYLGIGEYEKSKEKATKSLELDASQPYAFRIRALSNEFLGEYRKALLDIDQSIRIQPNDGITYLQRGILFDKLERTHESIIDYSKAIALMPNWLQAYHQRGCAYLKVGDYKPALRDFSHVAKNASSEELKWQASVMYITTLIDKGDIQIAKARLDDDAFNKLIVQGGDNAEAMRHYLRAMIAENDNDKSVAIREYTAQWNLTREADVAKNAAQRIAKLLNSDQTFIHHLDNDIVSILRQLLLKCFNSHDTEIMPFALFIFPFVSNPADLVEILKHYDMFDDMEKGFFLVGLVEIMPKVRLSESDKFDSIIDAARPNYKGIPRISEFSKAWMRMAEGD